MTLAKINLDKDYLAKERIERFVQSIQNGVTVYSATGLLFSLLTDLDFEVVEEPKKDFNQNLYTEGFNDVSADMSRFGIEHVAKVVAGISRREYNEYGIGYIAAYNAYKEGASR